MIFVDFAVNEDCVNPASYGEICISCNCCGRIDENRKYESQLELYKELLQEQYEFDGWYEGLEEIQKQNIESNIEYFKEKIARVEKLISK